MASFINVQYRWRGMYRDPVAIETKKKENVKLYEEGTLAIDPGIRRVVGLVNQLPGIAVCESCEGHLARDKKRVFVAFIATREGYEAFFPIFETICEQITLLPTSILGRKGSLLATMALPNNDYSKRQGKPCRWCHYFSFLFDTEEGRIKVIEIIEQVLERTLEDKPVRD